jgi:lysozyme family protein
MTIADAINETLDREGEAFTDDPRDPGGATKWGITFATAQRVYGQSFTVEQLRRLTRDDAFAIYLRLYVIDPGFSKLADERLRFVVFDFGVNSGPATATKSLQRALGVADDGVLGPQTLAASNALGADASHRVANAVAVDRALFCARLVQNDVNAFLKLFALLKREQPEIVRRYFPTRKDELDVAAFNHGWIRRALSDVV